MDTNIDSLADYSSTGHRLSNIDFLDAHYAVSRNTYEAMLRAVGIQPSWHVLDAGCGSGSYLPLMAELVGPTGRIDAFDLDLDNIERVGAIVMNWDVAVKTRTGNLTALPYDDNTFDAIWNANVTQYLTDDEMTQMLKEFVRVVKPGGLVAIKEADPTTLQNYPLDTFVFWRWIERNPTIKRWSLRLLNLPSWLEVAGLVEIRQKTFVEDFRAPLADHVYSFLAASLQFFAKEAEGLILPESDMEQWQRCQDPNSPDNPINHPEFYFREGASLIVGKRPAAS